MTSASKHLGVRTINKHLLKALAVLLALTVCVFIFSFRLGNRWGLFVAFLVLTFLYLVAFLLPPTFLEEKFEYTSLGGHDAWGINAYLQRLFLPSRETPPEVHVFDSDSVNAFLTARPFHSAKIFLSRAFLEKLSDQEIKAALVVLCSRLLYNDGFKETLMSLVRQIISGLGENLDQTLRTRIFSKIFTPVSRLFGRLLFSEKMIYRHDKWASESIEDKTLVAEVLRKLYAYSLSMPLKVPLGFEQDFIVTPDPLSKNYLPLQASVEKRLVQLQGIYPN